MSASPSKASDSFSLLDERIQRWIWQSGWSELKDAQEQAIPAILAGDTDVVIAAATASGKTEAAFLPILTRLLSTEASSCVMYISPLKALINDQWWRLEGLCESLEIPVTPWHGDIAGTKKRNFKKSPTGCLLITPESLEALLMANGHALQGLFGGLRYLVVDELHAFIGTERGKQLQSLMHRIDRALKRFTPRIALSATLGDMDKAAAFLRPNAAVPATVIKSNDAGQALKVLVKGFIDYPLALADPEAWVGDDADFEKSLSQGTRAISEHLFKTLRGSNNLVFPNSRGNVEKYAALLRGYCEDLGLPNEFWPHHGSLAKDVREETEAALKAKGRPATAVCTTTLEMGIDIGSVKSIAQIGCAPSVASLRQRLGRSGRRGEAAILRCYALEAALAPHSPLSDVLRENLVQSTAQVRLSLRSWYEPPNIGGLHLSTLIQQLLALIAQYGGINAADAWAVLCGSGVFLGVPKQDFILLLRELAKKDILIQTPTGLLLHGRVGEQLVNHYSFYAAFAAEEEFRLVHGGKTLGALPLSQPVEKGTHLIFAGKRWQVLSLDIEKKVIAVMPALGGKLPKFDGGNLPVDDGVREEMRQILSETLPIPFLDSTANQLLQEARATFQSMGLDSLPLLAQTHCVQLFPWRGDRVMNTLALMLKQAGFQAENTGLSIIIKTDNPEKVFEALHGLAVSPPPDPTALVAEVMNKRLEKWDALLPAELLAKNYSSHTLDVAGAHEFIKRLAARRHSPR
ncbi:DEAD/DEAH box helicase [Methylovulum psychrotolerans]|uniref:ATP-dependent RNA helicase DbpA n=1 Tax=Methylovulum psychrotolerans TaxID=1704499 RepID=A0A2S5CFW3_9GAMM|nr:DEAD/DEAH box helicase [Methylovulum psychrotolerans]POZ49699.1 ATP-dependent RNA helicase DbpA [Methylovulum psychrotolerans]